MKKGISILATSLLLAAFAVAGCGGSDKKAAEKKPEQTLKVGVTAGPEDGKANEAVVKLLAKAWGVPKSRIAVVSGATDRNKTLHIAGDPAELSRRLADWLRQEMTP